jgi:hypothetical protein
MRFIELEFVHSMSLLCNSFDIKLFLSICLENEKCYANKISNMRLGTENNKIINQ